MARPLLPDHLLKHKRRYRKSQTISEKLEIPIPSNAEKRRWKPIVQACINACLRTDRRDNIAPKEKVRVSFKKYSKRPAWWPIGRVVTSSGDEKLMEYSCDLLLRVLWEQHLADYNPHMIYESQRAFKMGLSREMNSLENLLDSSFEDVYNVEDTLE